MNKALLVFLFLVFPFGAAFANPFEAAVQEALRGFHGHFEQLQQLKANIRAEHENIIRVGAKIHENRVQFFTRIQEHNQSLSSGTGFNPNFLLETVQLSDELGPLKSEEERSITAFDALAEQYETLEIQLSNQLMLPLVSQYSWAIPNDAAINRISQYGPLLEIGAGSGYWAHLLAEKGVDVVAYDNHSWKQSGKHSIRKFWHSIQDGNEDQIDRPEHRHRTLFISWPPKTPFAFQALQKYQGSIFIYVGEVPQEVCHQPAMANPSFFDYLEDHFTIKETIDIPNWPGFSDKVYIFERKSSEPTS